MVPAHVIRAFCTLLFLSAVLRGAGVLDEALAAKVAGDYPRATRLLQELVEHEPRNSDALFHLGTVLGWTQRFPEALAVFEKGLALAPANIELRLGYGRVLAWSGQLERAEAVFRRVLADAPKNSDAGVMLGRVKSWRRDYDAADEAYRAVLAAAPDNVDAWVGLGDVQRWQERYPEALEFYRQAERRDPKSAEILGKIESLKGLGRWRLDAGLSFSRFAGATRSDWYGWDANLRYSLDRLTGLSGGVEWARRFALDDLQYTVGVDRRFNDRLSGYGRASFAPKADFLARRSFAAGAAWKLHEGSTRWPTCVLLGDVRFSTYGSRTAQTYWLGATQYLPRRLALTVKGSATRDLNAHGSLGWQARLDGDPNERVHWYAGLSDGRESLASTIYDFLRELRTRAAIAGLYYEFSPSLGLRLDYAFEWTHQTPNRSSWHAGLVTRF